MSNINAGHGSELIGYLGINVEASQQCGYFRSITAALYHVIGTRQVLTGLYDSVACSHDNRYTATDICSHNTLTLCCMLCGATYCGTVSVVLQHQHTVKPWNFQLGSGSWYMRTAHNGSWRFVFRSPPACTRYLMLLLYEQLIITRLTCVPEKPNKAFQVHTVTHKNHLTLLNPH